MTRPHSSSGKSPHVLFSGGGSGGHVFPGLAIADELVRRGWEVSWAGSRRGVEARLVGERQVDFHNLRAAPVLGRNVWDKVRAAATLARSALGGRRLVRRLGSRVVVGTGGYVSAPAVVGGRLASRPVLLLEPNAEAGVANRWLSRWASEAAVAHEQTRGQFRCAARVTGVPVRGSFFEVRESLPTSPPLRVLVLGGSQGARQLNELLPPALARLEGLGPLSVLHQSGHRKLSSTQEAYAAAELDEAKVEVEVVPFLEDVAGAMERAHLVVSRAGAITLAEICAAGRPSLLVPLAVAGGHQASNAQRLQGAGAACAVGLEGVTIELLADLLGGLLADSDRLQAMTKAARSLSRRSAASEIADRVELLGGQR